MFFNATLIFSRAPVQAYSNNNNENKKIKKMNKKKVCTKQKKTVTNNRIRLLGGRLNNVSLSLECSPRMVVLRSCSISIYIIFLSVACERVPLAAVFYLFIYFFFNFVELTVN